MAYGTRNFGTPVNGFNVSIQPGSPTFVAGQLILVGGGTYGGNPTYTAPSGWTNFAVDNYSQQLFLWGKLALGNNDAMPVIAANGQEQFAQACACPCGLSSLTGVEDPASADWQTQSPSSIVIYGAGTPQVSGSLCVALGLKWKTSATDSTVLSLPGGSPFTIQAGQIIAGNGPAWVWADYVQAGAPTPVPNPLAFLGSENDGTTQTTEGLIAILNPPAIVLPPTGYMQSSEYF